MEARRAALPARAGSRHTKSWKFGSSSSCYQHAAVLPRRGPLGEQERKQQPPPHPGAAQRTQKWSVHHSPVSRIRLSGTSLTARWEPQPGAKRLNAVRRKGRKSVSAPRDRGDDATWPKEKVQESSAICCSSQFPAPCLSFPIRKIGAMVGAACKAFFETCCRKMLYNSKELLKAAACPGPCLAQHPCVPPQDAAKPPGSNPACPSPPVQRVSGLL